MVSEVETTYRTTRPPQRRLRNYLLKPRFQLKYTGAVVLVTMVVGSVMGFFAYKESKSVSEMLVLQYSMLDVTDELEMGTVQDMQEYDQRILYGVVGFITILCLLLGIMGILVTHRVVGPAYKIERLINEVIEGKLTVRGHLRRGDELQSLFEAFSNMVVSLRERQQDEVDALTEAIQTVRDKGMADEDLERIIEVRDRMRATLDD
ncbi:MAG: hypothetical protein AAF550_02095 [Myxococcota bacterium]